jgi:hypothetical protein
MRAADPFDERAAVDGLAGIIVSELSPGEGLLFDDVRSAFWANEGRLPSRAAPGIGVDGGAQFAVAVAPIALAVASYGVRLLADIVRDMALHGGRLAATDIYRRVVQRLGRGEAPEETVPLAAAKHAALASMLSEEARRHLSPERADELAAAVMRRIAHREAGSS